MSDLASAIKGLLSTSPAEPEAEGGECQWCGQKWRANRTAPCRHFSPGAGHCPDCGRQWTGSREAHCASCHRHFSSDSAFDLHQHVDHGPCDVDGEHGPTCRAISVCADPKRLIQVDEIGGPVWSWPGRRPPESIPERASP